jgi:tRNA (guanine37-N1)-methyltransferase
MRLDILTLFPAICEGAFGVSMMKRAQEAGLAEVHIRNLRDWATDRHRTTDDIPFGGGQGMVLKPEPVFAAVDELRRSDSHVILMTPQGRRFDQAAARRLATRPHLILICGHYEGVDHRIVEALVDEEISIGDYVLTNGALAAAVVGDAVIRLIPGVLGDENSAADDSFSAGGGLEAPQYTRPAEFRGWRVPAVLLSGNHAAIAKWRTEQARERTGRNRPDLRRD